MQRNRCFPSSRTAVDDHDATAFIANDFVLLALDRLHNRGHVRGSRAIHSLVQRGLARDVGIVGFHETPGQVTREYLISNISDGASASANMTPDSDVFGLRRGGKVKRAGDGRATVEQQRAVVFFASV